MRSGEIQSRGKRRSGHIPIPAKPAPDISKRAEANSLGQIKAFGQKNLFLFIVALIVIVLGHISLGMGSITFAPVCLMLGYCILVPLAIII